MPSVYFEFYVKNGGSDNLNVDGSVTPVVFDISTETFNGLDITGISLYVEGDGNVTSYENFIAITGLTNGIIIESTPIDRTFSFPPIKSNRDMIRLFSDQGDFTLREIGNDNHYDGLKLLPTKSLILDSNSEFKATVSDDLTDLDYITIKIQGVLL